MAKERSIALDLLKGAIAGAAATWVMGRVTTLLYQMQDEETKDEETEARDGKTAYGVAAEKAAALFGQDLDDQQRQRLGMAIHWALGIGTGALYAALRDRWEGAGWAGGLGLGATFWGVVDEGMNPALGLTPGPGAFAAETHVRGLLGHLSFGVVTETTLKALDRVM